MILPALVVVLLVIGTPKVSADAPTWAVDYTRSRLGFSGTQGGNPFEGEFKRFDADIHFDPATLATSRVVVDIDMGSVETGNPERDAAVRDRDWFAVGQFPRSRFETSRIDGLGDERYQAAATLTMRDVTKVTTLPFTLTIDGDEAHAKGELKIVRTDWGIGQGQWAAGDTVGRDVVIRFDLLARRAS
jgi:Uncharacterized conserved protein